MAGFVIGIIVIIALAVIFLKGFDRVAGRGPGQVSGGIVEARRAGGRVPCPHCAEMILPQARLCPNCRSTIAKE